MKPFVVAAIALALLSAFHLSMRSLERRGLVYWTKRPRGSGTSGAGLGVLFELMQPSQTITVEEKLSQQIRRPVLPDERPFVEEDEHRD